MDAIGKPLDDHALVGLQALGAFSSKHRKRTEGLRPRDSFFSRQEVNRTAAMETQNHSDKSNDDANVVVQGLGTIVEGQRIDDDLLGHAGRSKL